MQIKQLLVLLAVASLSTITQADEDPSFSYLDISYIEHDMDALGIASDLDGYDLELSVNLIGNLFALVDHGETEGDNDFQFDTEGYGFGFHGDNWYASYTYNNWTIDSFETDVDTIRAGFRSKFTDKFEFNASYAWNDIDKFENEDSFQVGLVYELFDFLHLTTKYESMDGDLGIDYWSAGIRLSF